MNEFKQWERDVNIVMNNYYGVMIDDIPDMPWYDWYKESMTPHDAVAAAMERFNDPIYGGW